MNVIKIFLASPGDLGNEREIVRQSVAGYNSVHSIDTGLAFQVVGWEDCSTGIGRPQSLINPALEGSDYAMVLLANKWGSQPSPAYQKNSFSSGTEEEFVTAEALVRSKPEKMRDMVFLFKTPSSGASREAKVEEFYEALKKNKSHYFDRFADDAELERKVELQLKNWTLEFQGISKPLQKTWDARVPLKSIFHDPDGILQKFLTDSDKKTFREIRELFEAEDADGALAKFSQLASEGNPFVLVEYSKLLEDRGELLASTENAQLALNVARNSSIPKAICSALGRTGELLLHAGKFNESIGVWEEVIEVAKSAGLDSDIAIADFHIGQANRHLCNFAEAKKAYKRALRLDKQLNRRKGEAVCLCGLAHIDEHELNFSDAEKAFLDAIEAFRKANDISNEAATFNNLGRLKIKLGELEEAKRYFEQALRLHTAARNSNGQCKSKANLALYYKESGNLNAAISLQLGVLEIRKQTNQVQLIAQSYRDLGLIYNLQGNFELAEESHRNALSIEFVVRRPDELAVHHGNLANAQTALRKHVEAEKNYTKSIELNRKIHRRDGEALQLLNLANLLANQDRLSEAITNVQLASELIEENDLPKLTARLAAEHGVLAAKQGDPEGALRCFENAINQYRSTGLNSSIPQMQAAIEMLKKAFPEYFGALKQ
jgi:tetratricopeptide (TPR) repeat protein